MEGEDEREEFGGLSHAIKMLTAVKLFIAIVLPSTPPQPAHAINVIHSQRIC